MQRMVELVKGQSRQQLRPRLGIFGGGCLIVDDLMPSIRPHAHNGQNHLVYATHLAPLVAALVEPGRAGWPQYLAPAALDHKDRRGIGNGLGAPGVHFGTLQYLSTRRSASPALPHPRALLV